MLSIELLQEHNERENAAYEKEKAKTPKSRESSSRAKRITKQNPQRVANLPKKKR